MAEAKMATLTIELSIAPADDPSWNDEDSDFVDRDDAVEFLISEMRYRLGHMPVPGYIADWKLEDSKG